ncbi:MAG: hypothetical protein MRZ79_07600 [Bacteroidia bacterium]|nr:hypothetical protein [Bacteroidia bacterium]
MEELAKFIMAIGSFSILLPFLVTIIRWRSLRKEQLYLAYLVIFSFIIEGTALYLGRVLGMRNLFLLHILTIAEAWLFLLIFRYGLASKLIKNWYILLGIGFSIFSLTNSFFFETWENFNWSARIVLALLIVALSAHYYYLTSKELKVKRLEKVPMFWLVNGLFIYFSSSFIVYLFSNYLLKSADLSLPIWAIHALLGIIKNLFFTIVLWMKHPSLAH